ncbi:hypothetical protein AAC387_Pa07g1770 [Persea americana]
MLCHRVIFRNKPSGKNGRRGRGKRTIPKTLHRRRRRCRLTRPLSARTDSRRSPPRAPPPTRRPPPVWRSSAKNHLTMPTKKMETVSVSTTTRISLDTDDDMNYRRPNRHRADLRPPRASHEDTGGGTSSSRATSQPGHSRDEVPMTDQTDEEHSEYKDDTDDVMHAVQGSLKEWLLKDEVREKQQYLSYAYKLTVEDKAEIRKLAEDNRIDKRIIKSIAPSIYGHENIKIAIALAMFGGQEKNWAVYTTGKGSSAAGLSAAVGKDPITGAWTLQCGALVLADKGICLIDEFDNMNDRDRANMHEAMEQHSISISKAGIVTSLKARCSVIAAANPIGGRYDSLQTFSQNVNLTDPFISRFDILCVLKDIADPVTDEMLALFIVDNHYKSQPTGAKLDESISNSQDEVSASAHPEIIPQDLLKYITYSKLNVFPKLLEAHQEKLMNVYDELRDLSSPYNGNSIVTRHLESMIRMSEAHARMHLGNHVSEEDVDVAIHVLVDSISKQKFSVQIVLWKEVTGIYPNNLDSSLNMKIGFPVFSSVVEANYVRKQQYLSSAYKLTVEDKAEIRKLAEDNRIDKRIIKSIAPSIYGHENIKIAIALAMHSKIKVPQWAVYTTGKGSSAAGLSAAVGKDPITGAWTLQCGALVLADKGICLIDEFDNMNDRDRVSIHEAMEYDSLQTFSQNVNLTDPIVSCFDILCVLKDIADPVTDEMLALFIVDNHYKSQPTGATLDESSSNSQDEVPASAHPEIIPQEE